MKKKWIIIILALCLAAAGIGVFIWQGKSTKKGFAGVQERLKQEGDVFKCIKGAGFASALKACLKVS